MCGCKIKNKLSINIKIYFTITMVTNNNTNFLTLIKEKTAFFQKRNLDGFYFKNWNVQLILSSLSLFNPFSMCNYWNGFDHNSKWVKPV